MLSLIKQQLTANAGLEKETLHKARGAESHGDEREREREEPERIQVQGWCFINVGLTIGQGGKSGKTQKDIRESKFHRKMRLLSAILETQVPGKWSVAALILTERPCNTSHLSHLFSHNTLGQVEFLPLNK